MGVFYVDCTVSNVAARERAVVVPQLLVDTGSESTWLPEAVLRDLGVEVEKPNQQFVMANGEVVTRDIGFAILRVDGFRTIDEIVFAKDGDLSLLGAHTLEGFAAIIDARGKRLVAAGPRLAAGNLTK